MKPLHSIVLLDCLRLFQNFNACYFRREWALSSRVNIDRCTSTAADVHRGSAVAVWRHLQPTAIQNTFRSLLKFNQLFSGPYSTYSQIPGKSNHLFLSYHVHEQRNRQIAVRAVTAAISGGMIFLRPFFWDFAKVLSYCSAFYLRYFYITEFPLILHKQTKFYTSWMSFCLLHCLLHIYFVLTVSKRTMCFTSFGLHSCHQWTESWWLSTNTSTASITSSLLLDRLPPQPDCRQSYRQHRFFSSVDSCKDDTDQHSFENSTNDFGSS